MTTRQFITLAFLSWCSWSCAAQDPFAAIRYDSVVAYNFALNTGRPLRILNKDSTLNKTTVLPGRKLTPNDIRRLLSKLNNKDTYGGVVYACFEPKHAFLFYKEKAIVASIELCFECNTVQSNPQIPAVYYHYNKKNKEYQNWGFSDKGLDGLMEYCRGIGLEVRPILGRPPKE